MMVSYFLGSLVGILFATIALKQLMRAFELVQDIQSLFEQLTTGGGIHTISNRTPGLEFLLCRLIEENMMI